MIGFLVSNLEISKQDIEHFGSALEMTVDDFYLLYNPGEKFKEDRVFYQNEEYALLLDGIILNTKELKDKTKTNSMTELCETLLKEKRELFHEDFIGNYAGALYLKDEKKWVVFTNKLSSKQVFYYSENGKFIAGTLITDIVTVLRKNNIKYTFNKDAAYLMLNYGYMGTDDTFVKEIKKIEAGHYISFTNNESEDICYHRFTTNKYNLDNVSEEEIIDGIDIRFRKAIEREYQKDLEGGFNYHFRALTGGTDSRACAFVAHSLGFKNVFNYTVGVPEQADEKIAREISKYLGNNFVYLSNAVTENSLSFISAIDEATYISQGLVYYFEVAPFSQSKVELSNSSYGLLHGGAFSEAFLETACLKHPSKDTPKAPLHTYSNLLREKCPMEHLQKYENESIYGVYSVFFNKFNPTGRILTNIQEDSAFPGLDADLVEYCLSIPLEMRENYYIYHKWLFAKYPDAINFKFEKWNAKANDNRLKKWWGKVTRFGGLEQYFRCSKEKFPTMIREKFDLGKKIKPSDKALMPFDYWYEKDAQGRQYMRDYLNVNIDNPVIDDELKSDLLYMYENGLARPKSMVITVLAAAKLFFAEGQQ